MSFSSKSSPPKILVFDSGLGGLSVYAELLKARGDAQYLYLADDAVFPYGELSEARLVERVIELMDQHIPAFEPDLVVIACNTASTLVLPHLRQRYAVSFVGTVPAIKLAASLSASRHFSVLATPGTARRDYTHTLVADHAGDCHVQLVGCARLAGLAERVLRAEELEDSEIAAEIMPAFVEAAGCRTDTIVLACTHYPLLLDRLKRLAPWPVRWIDPAEAIARRVVQLLGPAGAEAGTGSILFTSGKEPGGALSAALLVRGLVEAA